VIGMTELMERTEMTARQRKFCSTIHRSASSLLDIINDILDFSKMEAHRLEIEPIECELAPLVEETMELLSTRAQGRELELIVDIQSSVPALVCVDPVRLRQVLTNLIGNAIKFTERGEVVVTVAGESLPAERARLRFSVADTGIGIAPEAHARLFEPFSQADASTTRRFGGTGLGLAIARQLVELMGGTMRIDSALGHGATFSFEIDVAVPAAARNETATPLLEGLRILVGDEHRASRELLTRQLESAGAIVVAAPSAEALPRILVTQTAPFDLLLLDQPITGVVLARHPSPVPIITMAAAAESGAGTELGSDSGVAGYLTKPVRKSLLIATIARVTDRGANLDQAHFLSSVGRAASGERLGLNVLIVEDNPVNQAVATGMLEALGCRAEIAGHGGHALERIAAGGIDVVLMDFQMPFMDGITATRRLREREAASHSARLPVIGVSAHAMQGAREECLIAGMNDFISKPFTMAELARVLRRHARRPLRAVQPAAALPLAAPAALAQGR
jgi:CheY-like chemotaxis protein